MPEIQQDELTDRGKSIQPRAFGDGVLSGYEQGFLDGQRDMRERAANEAVMMDAFRAGNGIRSLEIKRAAKLSASTDPPA